MKKALIVCAILLLLVCSCSKTVKIKDYSTDVEDYFLVNSTYHQQEEILRTCPIPLYIISIEEFATGYLSKTTYLDNKKTNFNQLHGMFVRSNSIKGWPKNFIFINSSLKPNDLIGTYFHELGHYNCYKDKCFCMKSNTKFVQEAHAIMNELRLNVANDFPIAVFSTIQDTIDYSFSKDIRYSPYKEASRLVQNTVSWDRAIDYLKNKGISTSSFIVFY